MVGIFKSWSIYIYKREGGAFFMPKKRQPKGLPGFR